MKGIVIFIFMLAAACSVSAQKAPYQKSAKELAMDRQDSVILAEMIYTETGKDAVTQAAYMEEEPDWTSIQSSVRVKFDEKITDRAITKAKIYYYFGKDWEAFSTAIVHYTNDYESKDNLKVMNGNAKLIAEHSENNDELKAALGWSKIAADKDPANEVYKATYEMLTAKMKRF